MKSKIRTSIQISREVSPNELMEFLRVGHGYEWTILLQHPRLLAHGKPPSTRLPELLITGWDTMIVSGGLKEYPDRIRNMIEVLRRRSQRSYSSTGGIIHG
ncbi:MAG: hypothetical protein GF411_12250 [Candidatus Lokiarchaeota archaeon]|nr:hypothetical protein [Candidatus Lokiarchaeota archaeon]